MPAPKYAIDWESASLRIVFIAVTGVAIVFLIAPTIIVLITSLTASESLKFPPPGFSLRWYYALLDADQMQRAARLRGMTLTGYLIATAGEDARRVVEDADIMRLAREDQIRFAEALINPPQPNARLARAAKRHAELIERR